MFNAQQFAARLAARKEGAENRWSLLTDFVAEWHAPLQDGDGYSKEELDTAERRLGFALPTALREWYGLAGKWQQGFNIDPYELVVPAKLSVEQDDGEVLWLFYEVQAGFSWGVRVQDMMQDDPPVYSGEPDLSDEFSLSNETFSEFILQVIVHQTACFTEIGGNASGKEDTADVVQANFLPLGLPSWQWPSYPAQLYGCDDVLTELDRDGKAYCWVWVAARSEAALQAAVKLFGLEWEHLYNGVPVDEN